MIGRLTGKLLEKHPPQVLLEVQGVGYEIDVPMSTFYDLPAIGGEITLYTHLVIREDMHLLFGFATEPERQTFRQLIKISGIGARTALALLSGLSVADLHHAVSTQDSAQLVKVPGIGKKTAERLLLELRDKLNLALLNSDRAYRQLVRVTYLMPYYHWDIATVKPVGLLSKFLRMRWCPMVYGKRCNYYLKKDSE